VNQVQDLLFLADGSAMFTDFNNHLVRRVKGDGTVESVVGWTDPIFPGDGPLGGIPAGGAPGSDWQLFHPTGMVLASDGSVVVVAWHDHKLIGVDPDSGWVQVVCGGGPSGSGSGFSGDGGPGPEALLLQPSDATRDEAGNLYIVDQLNQRVRVLYVDGSIDTFAGSGEFGSSGDDGPAIDAQFSWAGGSNPNPSGGIVQHAGKLYVSDSEAHRIRVIDLQSGIISAFAGNGSPGYAGDGGPALDAALNAPRDLAIGPDGDLYVADTDNGAVRAIDLESGTIRTVVGTGELGLDDEEQLPATQIHLRRPFGVAFDADGNLYVADSLNNRIVKIAR
jgi:hypothetical protein